MSVAEVKAIELAEAEVMQLLEQLAVAIKPTKYKILVVFSPPLEDQPFVIRTLKDGEVL